MDFVEGEILAFDKPYRWTSFDVVGKARWLLCHKLGVKKLKVGHSGTLDPLATGVVVVCTGKKTKLIDQLQAHQKEYVATLQLGATTPSFDLEKEIDRFFPHEHISAEAVSEALPGFLGEQDQVAPLFSAKSVDGVRAYELARKLHKEGKTLDEAAQELIRTARITISGTFCPSEEQLQGLNGDISLTLPVNNYKGLQGYPYVSVDGKA